MHLVHLLLTNLKNLLPTLNLFFNLLQLVNKINEIPQETFELKCLGLYLERFEQGYDICKRFTADWFRDLELKLIAAPLCMNEMMKYLITFISCT